MKLAIRAADATDVPAIHALAERAVAKMLTDYYSPAQLAAGEQTQLYQVEPELIADGTYYVIEVDGSIVGGSGWSHRGTFHPPGAVSDHTTDPGTATMRATYVDPRWTRRGFARLLAQVTETAAAIAGFRRFEAMCTPPSEALRRSMGYELVERMDVPVLGDISWSAALMRKEIVDNV
ncbi:GNAT family N-acetyltransferase [Kribbella sp. NPDC051952]|uniref:GNAT family N-acetyltransferase n=1 Tax=Kribbella sp. NPDC051952 TaxID=3154851 RepID=UPI00341EF76E